MKISRRQLIRMASAATIAGGLLGPGCVAANRNRRVSSRALSLRVLQEKLEGGYAMAGERAAIRDLAGITRMRGFAVDHDRSDIVLFGSVDPDWPALKLEDFTVALRNAFYLYTETIGDTAFYSYPGCSIDPDAEFIARLESVNERVADLVASGREEMAKAVWLDACRSPQSVKIFGVPDSRFADICVVADYRMKALCDGSLELDVDGFESLARRRATRVYADMRHGRNSTVSGSSMNRFWFTPGAQRFKVDDGISVIDESSVALRTEREMLTAQGTIAGTGTVDADAEQWALDFTGLYGEIARAEGSGVYFQLQQLFDHVALAKLLVRESTRSGLPSISVLLQGLRIAKVGVPNELEGRGNLIPLRHVTETTHKILTRTASLQLCGGVGINVDITEENIAGNVPGMKSLRGNVVAARPEQNRLWWNLPDEPGVAS